MCVLIFYTTNTSIILRIERDMKRGKPTRLNN